MKPYRRANKALMLEIRSASSLSKLKIYLREFCYDVTLLWKYWAPYPTIIKLVATVILCLLLMMPLIYPGFVLFFTYFVFRGLYQSWRLDDPKQFSLTAIAQKMTTLLRPKCNAKDIWKVCEMLTRGILVIYSLATSVDYLCVMQTILDL